MSQYSMRWCDRCKQWVRYGNDSTILRCPYCYNDLTIEKSPKEGHWIPADIYHEDMYVCSACYANVTVPINFNYRPTYKYCPYCGEKMNEV